MTPTPRSDRAGGLRTPLPRPDDGSYPIPSITHALVGGLTFSTAVTLVLLPSIYLLLDDLRLGSRSIVRAAKG